MALIKFYCGDENGVVVENSRYEESIFKDQYIQALLTIDKIIANPSKNEPSIVAFCGDRGEGKTSCMTTIMRLLKQYSSDQEAKHFIDSCFLDEKVDNLRNTSLKITDTKMEILEVIDPAFFDTYHNVLELVLGQMYERFLTYVNDNENREEMRERRKEKEKVMGLFHDAKLCWTRISKGIETMYDPLEELDSLAAGLSLRTKMDDLIKGYLNFIYKNTDDISHKSQLVVCIDDLDLNINQAYEMAEQIRKYLVSDSCLLLVSLNANQLVDVVANYLDRLTAPSKDLGTQQMATKYVAKLVPLECRIIMPKIFDICNEKLEIYSERDGILRHSFNSIKEAVVRLTYNKTRFLFYNSKGGISPLVPNNLRSLRHLLGLLLSMPNFIDNDVSNSNKNAFRSYFYQTWTRQLEKVDQEFTNLLVKGDDATTVNKLVVSYLHKKIKEIEGGTSMTQDIGNPINYNYNVSLGDVFYMINYLERSNVNEELALMLFFIKSFYSIRLYEYYDIITEQEGELSPVYTLDGEVYKSDGWFKRTNMMQRFVNGSYFTFSPKDLLPPTAEGKNRDLKSYSGKLLYSEVLKDIKEGMMRYNDMDGQEKKVYQQKFRIAEFFALTVKKSISRRKVENADKVRRDYSEPFHLTDFNTNTYYLVFDVMSPFYNLLNPQYTYDRFAYLRKIEGRFIGFYEFAYSHEWSLLRRMIDYVRLKEYNEGCNQNKQIKTIDQLPEINGEGLKNALLRLMSNACLRNGEVLSAMMESIQSRRDNWHNRKDNLTVLNTFYGYIINSEMRTYKNAETDRPYILRFVFLEAFRELLSDIDNNSLLAVIYNSDYDTKNITDDDIMQSYRRFFDSFKFNKKGKMVVSDIKRHYPDFYALTNDSEWVTLFPDEDSFTKSNIIKILRDKFVQQMGVAVLSEVNDIDYEYEDNLERE